MGTQQLLLIVLGVIIVGISVVIGFTIFGSNADQANKDAITQDCLRMAATAQEYYLKPTLLGGGNNSFNGITLADCGVQESAPGSAVHDNLNGLYSIAGAGVNLTITGTAHIDPMNTVTVAINMSIVSADDRVTVGYTGW